MKQVRLQKVLAQAGIASRRTAEQLIAAGRVTVNAEVVTELGTKVDPLIDRITVDGKPALVAEKKLYLLLHKPAGYVTTLKDPQGRPIVTELIKGVQERLFPVGRLDYNTEGVLLLTNDGELANRLAHPRYGVEKEYHVRVRGIPSDEQLRLLSQGVELDDGPTSSAKASLSRVSGQNSWISLAIHEGRYRQVRRMCSAVGLTVVRLKRVRYGFLELGDLKPGEFRMLSEAEVAMLVNRPSGGRVRQKSGEGQNIDKKERQIATRRRAKRQFE